MAESQSYKNHTRWLPPFHCFAVPVLLVNVLVQVPGLWRNPGLGSVWTLVVAVALLFTVFLARTQALAAQDRVIRLEMRLRLRQVLPGDLQARIEELTPRQLVALRFASDGELPELVRDVLAGTLKSGGEIKARVRSWQGDYLRV